MVFFGGGSSFFYRVKTKSQYQKTNEQTSTYSTGGSFPFINITMAKKKPLFSPFLLVGIMKLQTFFITFHLVVGFVFSFFLFIFFFFFFFFLFLFFSFSFLFFSFSFLFFFFSFFFVCPSHDLPITGRKKHFFPRFCWGCQVSRGENWRDFRYVRSLTHTPICICTTYTVG